MALATLVDLFSWLGLTVNVPILGNAVRVVDLQSVLLTSLKTLTISITEIASEWLGRLMRPCRVILKCPQLGVFILPTATSVDNLGSARVFKCSH